jgi:hypothetical protein
LAATEGVAAIDAPFSLPRSHAASAVLLWAEVAQLPTDDRPFGRGADLVATFAPTAGPHGVKLYRACEAAWRGKNLNVRSTLWCGPRGGAAFSVACMTLLRRHTGPVWPFRPAGRGALLVETYPAAQLVTWGLSPVGYNGPKPNAKAARLRIVEAMARDHGLRASDEHLRICAENADALDAVICAYGAKAMLEGRHPRRLPAAARSEGWIVIDDPAQPIEAPPSENAGLEGPIVSPTIARHIQHLFASVHEAADEPPRTGAEAD